MQIPTIQSVTEQERDQVLATATMAFSTDPLMRWIFPRAHDYLLNFPGMVELEGFSLSLASGNTHATEGFEGIAIWLGPGMHGDEEEAIQWLTNNVRPEIYEDFMHIISRIEAIRAACEPCMYLAFLGVDPAHQRKGIGSILLKHMTKTLDEQSQTAYLESSNPENISLYERHGFERIEEVRTHDSPTITPMIRRPHR